MLFWGCGLKDGMDCRWLTVRLSVARECCPRWEAAVLARAGIPGIGRVRRDHLLRCDASARIGWHILVLFSITEFRCPHRGRLDTQLLAEPLYRGKSDGAAGAETPVDWRVKPPRGGYC